jgi:CheY-like chemotaxis protein
MYSTTCEQKTILIVEDDSPLRSLMVDLLADEGYAILQAEDGRHGLELAQEHQPDLILLDLKLGQTSGLDLLEKLRAGEFTRYIPVVVVSGDVLSTDESTNQQPNGVLHKPFDIGDLLAHVHRLAATAEP